jgi:hypothetical protein
VGSYWGYRWLRDTVVMNIYFPDIAEAERTGVPVNEGAFSSSRVLVVAESHIRSSASRGDGYKRHEEVEPWGIGRFEHWYW